MQHITALNDDRRHWYLCKVGNDINNCGLASSKTYNRIKSGTILIGKPHAHGHCLWTCQMKSKLHNSYQFTHACMYLQSMLRKLGKKLVWQIQKFLSNLKQMTMLESALGTVDTFKGCSTSDVLLPVISGRGMPAHLFLLPPHPPNSTHISCIHMVISW